MRKPFRKQLPLPLAFAMIALLSLGQACGPGPLEPGTDCWKTDTGTQQSLRTLPAGFFNQPGDTGPKSDAIPNPLIELMGNPLSVDDVANVCNCPESVDYTITWLDPHGTPVPSDSRHAVSQQVTRTTSIDTCIRRTVAANVGETGTALDVAIELVKLSLKSVEPLTVTYGGGPPGGGPPGGRPSGGPPGDPPPTKQFDVFVTESGTQRPGQMTFTTNTISGGQANGNTSMGVLHIDYDVTFVEVGNPGNTFPRPGLTLTLKSGARPGDFVK